MIIFPFYSYFCTCKIYTSSSLRAFENMFYHVTVECINLSYEHVKTAFISVFVIIIDKLARLLIHMDKNCV